MSEYINSQIDQDWDALAIKDGSVLESEKSYTARLEDRNGNVETSNIDSISYRPEINSAPSLSVDIEPKSVFEGESFLGGVLDVFADGDILFSGEIRNISFSKKEGEYYTVKAYSPGRKLKDETATDSVSSMPVGDYVSLTVDRYNDYDNEHYDMIDTSDEVLTDIFSSPIGSRSPTTSSLAVAEYKNVGPDASNIEIIPIKLFVPDSIDAEVKVSVVTSSSSYSETFGPLHDNEYGTWVNVNPSGLDAESYDIKFEFSLAEDAVLYNWISLTEQEIQRTNEVSTDPNFSKTETVADVDTQAEWDNATDETADPFPDDSPVYRASNFVSTHRSCFTGDTDEQSLNTFKRTSGYNVSNASSGEYGILLGYQQSIEYGFSLDYKVPVENFQLARRETLEDGALDNFDGEVFRFFCNYTISGGNINGTSNFGSTQVAAVDEGTFEWTTSSGTPDVDGDYIEPGGYLIEASLDTLSFEDTSEDAPGFGIDIIAPYDDRYSYNFDNNVDANGYLSGPEYYGNPEFDVDTVIASRVVDKVDVTTDPNQGKTPEIAVSFDGSNYETTTDTNTFSVEAPFVTKTVDPRFKVGRYGSRTNETPTEGYLAQEFQGYTIDIEIGDLDIIESQSFSDNRLSIISSVADNSDIIFRWEGNNCRIFNRGSKTSDVTLNKEDVSSSIDIEDTYSSVEVIGKDGVSSGVVEADNAPSFIDRHKEIRDRDIETEDDAVRRANSFLNSNSTIEYSASVSTLPTKIPVGVELDGSNFTHGKDVIVESGRYRKNRSSFEAGQRRDFGRKMLELDRGNQSSLKADTS